MLGGVITEWLKDKEQVYKELEPVELRELTDKKYKEKLTKDPNTKLTYHQEYKGVHPNKRTVYYLIIQTPWQHFL